jgi:hypothetical protein
MMMMSIFLLLGGLASAAGASDTVDLSGNTPQKPQHAPKLLISSDYSVTLVPQLSD